MILEASRPSAPGSGRGFEGERPSVTPCVLTLNKAAWISERPPLCSAAGPGGTHVTKEGLSVFMVGLLWGRCLSPWRLLLLWLQRVLQSLQKHSRGRGTHGGHCPRLDRGRGQPRAPVKADLSPD